MTDTNTKLRGESATNPSASAIEYIEKLQGDGRLLLRYIARRTDVELGTTNVEPENTMPKQEKNVPRSKDDIKPFEIFLEGPKSIYDSPPPVSRDW